MYGIQGVVTQSGQTCLNCQLNRSYIDPEIIATNFLMEYYRNVSNSGWNTVMYLFDPNSSIICRKRNIGTAYDMLNVFSAESIKRANYDSLRPKWLIVDNNTMMINVFGLIQFVTFSDQISAIIPFTETFILKGDQNNNVKCTHHIFDF